MRHRVGGSILACGTKNIDSEIGQYVLVRPDPVSCKVYYFKWISVGKCLKTTLSKRNTQ